MFLFLITEEVGNRQAADFLLIIIIKERDIIKNHRIFEMLFLFFGLFLSVCDNLLCYILGSLLISYKRECI